MVFAKTSRWVQQLWQLRHRMVLTSWAVIRFQLLCWLRACLAFLLALLRSHRWNPFAAASSSSPLRPGVSSVSPRWMEQVLRSNGVIDVHGVTVARVEAEALDGNRGLTGAISRLRVTYDRREGEKQETKQLPTTFILKMSGASLFDRYVTLASQRYREAWFYRSSLARGWPVARTLPPVLYAHGSALFGEFVILMADVTSSCSSSSSVEAEEKKETTLVVPTNMIFGNQVWGIPPEMQTKLEALLSSYSPSAFSSSASSSFSSKEEELQVHVLRKMFGRAADMHAHHWRDPSLLSSSFRWLKGALWYHGQDRASWELSVQRGRNAWLKHRHRFLNKQHPQQSEEEESKEGLKFSSKMVRIMDESFARASWEALQAHLHDPSVPWTLCHGDFHSSNTFYLLHSASRKKIEQEEEEKDEMVWFDWSEVGLWEPTADLAQVLISDVRPDVFIKHSRQLLQEAYYQRLQEAGCVSSTSEEEKKEKGYTFDACWKAFCRGGPERWIWVLAIILDIPFLPEKALQYFHDQLLAFIESHGDYAYYQLKPVVCIG